MQKLAMSVEPPASCIDAQLIGSFEGHELLPHLARLLSRGRPLASEELASKAAGSLPVAPMRSLGRACRWQRLTSGGGRHARGSGPP
jgi:hypothetical protein